MRAYIDADVLIWHLRGKEQARDFLIRLREHGAYELWTGALQRAEIVFFMRPDEHETTELFLSQFKTEPVDQKLLMLPGSCIGNGIRATALMSMMRCSLPQPSRPAAAFTR